MFVHDNWLRIKKKSCVSVYNWEPRTNTLHVKEHESSLITSDVFFVQQTSDILLTSTYYE